MQATEDTQPRRGDVFPEEEYEDNSPGCAVWGIVGAFGILLSLAIVLAAAEAGVRQGANIGERTAVARTQEFVARECEVLPTDIALERVSIVRTRYDNWAQRGEIPLCAQAYIPQATQIYINNRATDTPMATATLEATATDQPTDIPTAMVESTAEVDSASAAPTSLYDLAGLLQEARDFMSAENYPDAIRTLDAIAAIDPNYETATVNQLLFTSLTTRARNLYITGGSLAEAVQLTTRAESFGDIGELSFERSVAQLYLDAQGFLNVNYPAAIQQLNQVRTFATNYRNTNQLLAQQYEGYGDALVAGGEPCSAVQQYDTLLAIQQQPSVQVKRDNAQNQCNSIGIVPTFDPNATVDPNAPTAAPTQAIAPVGQQGG